MEVLNNKKIRYVLQLNNTTNGKIYGMPFSSTDILIIDTSNGTGGDFNTILQPYFNKL